MPFKALGELDHTEGTVQLVEKGLHSNASHLGSTNIVLIPQPSTDPNDPLRWPTWRKYVAFISVCAFAFLTNVSIGGLSPAFYPLSLEFNKSINTAAGLLTWCILVLGLGNFFWVPTALYFGKRPVFLIASLLLCLCNAWAAVATSFQSLLAARLVASFAGASTEALGAAIVNDIFFLHERGSKMGIYIIFLAWGNSLGPLCGGFIIGSLGWRWFCWVCTIFTGVIFLSVLVLVPESRFFRDINRALNIQGEDASATGKTGTAAKVTQMEDARAAGDATSDMGPRKPWLQQLSPWSGIDRSCNYFALLARPLPLALYPAVVFATAIYSVSLAWVIAVSTLNSFVLQQPPYNFSPGINGLINIPAMIGNLVGAVCGGYLTDVYSKYRAKRNNGVFEPETRLHLLIVPAVCVPIGLLMFGYGVQNQMSWAVLFVAYGFINVGLTGAANIGMTYVMDSYYPIAADALLMINGLKNVVAFGFTYGVVPWITAAGYTKTFGTMTGIFLGMILLAVPLTIFGRRIRHVTSSRWRLIWWPSN